MNQLGTGGLRKGQIGAPNGSFRSHPAPVAPSTTMVTPEPDLDISAWQNMTRTLAHYERLEQIGEGTYGQVYRARCKDTGRIVAMKKMRIHHGGYWGMPLQLIREIKILKRLHHPRLLSMIEVVTSKGVEHLDTDDPPLKNIGDQQSDKASDARESYKGNLFLVLEYVEHDLTGLLDVAYHFEEVQIKSVFKQLLEALSFMHEHKYVHRDIKSSNILLDSQFRLKLADFGLARCIEPSILEQMQSNNDRSSSSVSSSNDLTNKVITLWYRPPEILLGACQYGPGVDVWSAGCILAELLLGKPLFPGKTELETLNLIIDLLGTPDSDTWTFFERMKKGKPQSSQSAPLLDLPSIRDDTPSTTSRLREKYQSKVNPPALNLLEKLLEWDPRKRLTAANALQHSYFWKAPAAPDDPTELGYLEVGPTGHFHEFQTKKKRREAKQAAEQARSQARSAGATEEEADEAYSKKYTNIMKKVAQEGIPPESKRTHEQTSAVAMAQDPQSAQQSPRRMEANGGVLLEADDAYGQNMDVSNSRNSRSRSGSRSRRDVRPEKSNRTNEYRGREDRRDRDDRRDREDKRERDKERRGGKERRERDRDRESRREKDRGERDSSRRERRRSKERDDRREREGRHDRRERDGKEDKKKKDDSERAKEGKGKTDASIENKEDREISATNPNENQPKEVKIDIDLEKADRATQGRPDLPKEAMNADEKVEEVKESHVHDSKFSQADNTRDADINQPKDERNQQIDFRRIDDTEGVKNDKVHAEAHPKSDDAQIVRIDDAEHRVKEGIEEPKTRNREESRDRDRVGRRDDSFSRDREDRLRREKDDRGRRRDKDDDSSKRRRRDEEERREKDDDSSKRRRRDEEERREKDDDSSKRRRRDEEENERSRKRRGLDYNAEGSDARRPTEDAQDYAPVARGESEKRLEVSGQDYKSGDSHIFGGRDEAGDIGAPEKSERDVRRSSERRYRSGREDREHSSRKDEDREQRRRSRDDRRRSDRDRRVGDRRGDRDEGDDRDRYRSSRRNRDDYRRSRSYERGDRDWRDRRSRDDPREVSERSRHYIPRDEAFRDGSPYREDDYGRGSPPPIPENSRPSMGPPRGVAGRLGRDDGPLPPQRMLNREGDLGPPGRVRADRERQDRRSASLDRDRPRQPPRSDDGPPGGFPPSAAHGRYDNRGAPDTFRRGRHPGDGPNRNMMGPPRGEDRPRWSEGPPPRGGGGFNGRDSDAPRFPGGDDSFGRRSPPRDGGGSRVGRYGPLDIRGDVGGSSGPPPPPRGERDSHYRPPPNDSGRPRDDGRPRGDMRDRGGERRGNPQGRSRRPPNRGNFNRR